MKRIKILYIIISLMLCSALTACGQGAVRSGNVPEAPESSPGLDPQSVVSPDQSPEPEASQTPTPTPTPTPERKPSSTDIALDQLNTEWMLKFNEESMDIMDFYFDNTAFFSDGKFEIVNRDVMGQFIENRYTKNMKLKSIEAIFRDKTYYFTNEIGSIVTESGETLQYLCVWVKKEGTWLRAVEAIAEKSTDMDFSSDIDKTKEAFLDILNSSDIEALVDRCVAADAVNFCNDSNNVFQGKEEFIFDFNKYMKYLPKGFETKMMTSVNESLVFELGRTRSSNYAYAYIWVRESDGQWKMVLFTQ